MHVAKQRVECVAYTPKPEDVIYAACKRCTTGDTSFKYLCKLANNDVTKRDKFIAAVIRSGHESVMEHVSFTFDICGIPRSLSHQLVRHRLASYSQQSQRYLTPQSVDDECDIPVVIPTEIIKDDTLTARFLVAAQEQENIYNTFRRELKETGKYTSGQINEISRELMPTSASTNIMMTMNARSLKHFIEERTCSCAQLPIRTVALQILYSVKEILPCVFKRVGPKCMSLGYCTENPKRSCGRKPLKKDVLGYD